MIFQLATGLIKLAQLIWPKGLGMGSVKKTIVEATVSNAVAATGGILTGGGKKTFDEMGGEAVIADFIEQVVGSLFPDKPEQTASEQAGVAGG
jgi:hypothetical protein